jgi:lipoate-protein ligase B
MLEGVMPAFEVRDLGRMRYGDALAIQQDLVEQRKQGLIPDQLLFVEHHARAQRPRRKPAGE